MRGKNIVHKGPTNIRYVVVSFLVTCTLLYYLFSTISFLDVIALFQQVSIRFITFFVLFSLAMSLFRTWRYQLILLSTGYQVNSSSLFLVTLVRNLFSDLLPARIGTLVYVYLVRNRLGIPFGAAAASFALSFVFDIVVLALLLILAALFVSSGIISTRVILSGGVVLAFVSIVLLYYLPAVLRVCAKVCFSLRFISEEFCKNACQALLDCADDAEFARRQGIFRPIFLLSFGVRCCKYLALYSLLLAFVLPQGLTVSSFPLPKVFLGLCSAELASSLPVSGIAGFGAYEGAWILVFKLLGYSERLAALTSISHHMFTQMYGYSLGGVALLVLMLPYFYTTTERRKTERPGLTKIFRRMVMGGLVVIIPLVFFFLSIHDNPSGAGLSGKESMPLQEDWAALTSELSQKIRGKVVYQRPNGIYVTYIGGQNPALVAANGSNPRWSPDGDYIAYREGNKIMLITENGKNPRLLATAKKAGTLCFEPGGRAVYFTDEKAIRRVELESLTVTIILQGEEFLEIDVAQDGGKLAATVRTLFGYRVKVFDLLSGMQRTVAAGCSASLSPDGNFVSVNGRDHKVLSLFNWKTLKIENQVYAPGGRRFDNQFWSNSTDWIVSTSEGERQDIFLHYLPEKKSYKMTFTGDCDRGDLFVSGQVH